MRWVFVGLWVGYLRDRCCWRRLDMRYGHWGRGQRLLSGRLASTLDRRLGLGRRRVWPLLWLARDWHGWDLRLTHREALRGHGVRVRHV